MRSHRLLGLAVLGLALLAGRGWSAAPPRAESITAEELARRIDRHIHARIQAEKAVAAPRAEEGEFLRRVYLDLAGRAPRVSEVRSFLEDRSADKRHKLIDKLLAGQNYVHYLTTTWRGLLVPSGNNQQAQFLANQIDPWVRERIKKNAPYNAVVRELLTTTVGTAVKGGRPVFNPGLAQGPRAFFQVNEMKADNIAAAATRTFLGVKLECAQCHDHPFAKWTRKQFWETAAFFGGIKQTAPQAGIFSPATDDRTVHTISMPSSEKKIEARFLDGKAPAWGENVDARATFADWATAPDNPFFARATVNRLWEHLFGIGLVDPADDFRDDNDPSHPALLDELARAFVASNFDLKYIIRAIVLSEAYQRTSSMTDASQEDVRLFARVPLKGLTGEQLFDSLVIATGYREGNRGFGRVVGAFGSPRAEFLTRFNNPVDRRTEPQTSILQALSLMNGRFIGDATSLDRSEILAAVSDAPFMTARQKLDTLYLAALARPMRASEEARLVPYVEAGGPSRDSRKALADVFWVLLNSSEFLFNH